MAIGPFVRQMLGPLERPVSEVYRGIFVDLTALVEQIKHWGPASKILEVGCGEGSMTERIVKTYSNAYITGIDITSRLGRMFQGDLSRVTFRQQTIRDFVVENSCSFDLVIISDVMHHVPWDMHKELLTDAGKALKPGGYLVLKDWERSATPIHLLCYLTDRYITGDRVQHKTADEFRVFIRDVFGANCIKDETRIRPWSNNIAFLVQV
jgi:2-polyprenyl-6-hydroxyphenyl methylase/3-demethylubiquinone-9 3-methyltransferase